MNLTTAYGGSLYTRRLATVMFTASGKSRNERLRSNLLTVREGTCIDLYSIEMSNSG